MKFKKETISKIILGILMFILIIYISFNLIFLSLFNISKKFLNKDNVSEFINKIDIISILKEELGNEVQNFISIETDFKNIGITTEGINEFLKSSDVKEFSSNIVTNAFDKIINNKLDNYHITSIEVTNLIENNIEKLQTKSSVSQTQLLDNLNKKIPNIVKNINELIDKLCDKLENSNLFIKYKNLINLFVGIFDIIYSDFVLCCIIFILISLIVLLIFIRRNVYKSLKWISISFIIPGIILYLTNLVLTNYINIDNLLINNIINIIGDNLNKHSIIYITISLIIIFINIIIYFINKYKSKKELKQEK